MKEARNWYGNSVSGGGIPCTEGVCLVERSSDEFAAQRLWPPHLVAGVREDYVWICKQTRWQCHGVPLTDLPQLPVDLLQRPDFSDEPLLLFVVTFVFRAKHFLYALHLGSLRRPARLELLLL